MLRVTAENLNRLLGLAGESLVESRWVKPFAESLLRLKRLHHELGKTLDSAARSARRSSAPTSAAQAALADAQRQRRASASSSWRSGWSSSRCSTAARINLAHRLYDEALACRMRPFADGVQGVAAHGARPRAARSASRCRLEIVGEATQVDRDILAKLDAPLGHLLRNAVDHGIESPEERRAAGKPAEGVVRLEARHSAGALQIIVSDDGRGVDLETDCARPSSRGSLIDARGRAAR